jgi:hypothetical protein
MQRDSFTISIKQPHANVKDSTSLFESSSLYLAMCSYRNQLVQFIVRISFVSMCLLGSNRVDQENEEASSCLGNFDERKSFEMYKSLSRLFNKEFIFHAGDESKDFKDSLSYLLHTNLIRVQSSSHADGFEHQRKFELVKMNMRMFFFFARSFLYILQNYVEIYRIISASSLTTSFNDEKTFVKSIQTTLFDRMLSLLSSTSTSSSHLFDFESLSLNLISNSILCLAQFDILIKHRSKLGDQSSFEIDTSKLKLLDESLIILIRTNRHKLCVLSKILKSFEIENNLESKFYGAKDVFDFDYFNYDSATSGHDELTHQHFECFGPNSKAGNLAKL